jgi:hypothetical protein
MRVIVVEYPGYGLNKGKSSSQSILEDANLVYDYIVKKIGYAEKNVIILGR